MLYATSDLHQLPLTKAIRTSISFGALSSSTPVALAGATLWALCATTSAAPLQPYNPNDNDAKLGSQIVAPGGSLTISGPQQFQSGDDGASTATLGALQDQSLLISGEDVIGAPRLNTGSQNFGVTIPDPITGDKRVVSTYDSANLIDLAPIDRNTSVPDIREVHDGQYIDARVGTVTSDGGTLTVDIGTTGATSTAATNAWNIAAKQSSLFYADGTAGNDSQIEWNSNNRISFTGSVATNDPALTFNVPFIAQYGGTFSVTTVDGSSQSHTVTNATELKAYNDWLISQLESGNLDSSRYLAEFAKGFTSTQKSITYVNSAHDTTDEVFQGIGLRTVMHTNGAGASATLAAGANLEVSNANGGAMRAETGSQLINNGTLSTIHDAGDGTAMELLDGSNGDNNGVINGNFLVNANGSITNSSLGGRVVDVQSGSTFHNNANAIINIATGTANNPGISSGIYLGDAAQANNSGVINVGVTGTRSNGSLVGILVDSPNAQFSNDAAGLIYIGRGPQFTPGSTPNDVSLNQGTLTTGITVNGDATAANAGQIVIGSKTQNAAGILVNGGANATVSNTGTIDVNGKAAAVPRENIGILVLNAGSGGGVTHDGTINLNGVNGTGIKIQSTTADAASVTSNGTINVAGGADPTSGTRNFGIWAEGTSTGTAHATVNGGVNLLGDGAIGIHARGRAIVDVAANAVPTFSSGSNQIGFFAYGPNARINVGAGALLAVTTTGSTLARVEAGSRFNGTGLTLTASGERSVAVVASGASGTQLNTQDAHLNVTGTGATGIIVEGGAVGTIDAATDFQLIGTGSVAGIVDGQKHSLSGANSGTSSTSTTLTSAAALNASADQLTGYIARNRAQLLNTGAIDFTGKNTIGIRVETGATANNSGNINVTDGSTAILVDGTQGNATTLANNSGQINVAGGATAQRTRGVVAQGSKANANLQTGAQLNLLGVGSIGAEALNGGTVNVTSPATPTFGASEQIAFHAQGAGSRVNSDAAAIDASTERSIIYRLDDQADLTLSGTPSLQASGNNSRAIVVNGAQTSVNTGQANLLVSGSGATGLTVSGGANGTLAAETTVNLQGSSAIGGIADGFSSDLAGTVGSTPVATQLTLLGHLVGTGANATGLIARNAATLTNTGNVSLGGVASTGVLLQTGGELSNDGSVQIVNGTGVRIENGTSRLTGTGNITVDDGTAGVQVLSGARLLLIGNGQRIQAGGSAHGILLDSGSQGLAAVSSDITTTGNGNGIENKAENSGIQLQDVTINTVNGAGIRTATPFNPNSTVTLNVSSSGSGLAFRNADSSTTSSDLFLGSGYHVNANGGNAIGIQALTTGQVQTSAVVNVGATDGGAALVAGTASQTLNIGTLSSQSFNAPVVDLSNGNGTTLQNVGTISAASPNLLAIQGSAGSDQIRLTSGTVRGDIHSGNGSDTFVWTGGSLDGGLHMGSGIGNQALLQGVDLSTTYHLVAEADGNSTLTLNNIDWRGGSYATDDLTRGVNLGQGWNTINLVGTQFTLNDHLQLANSTVNIDPDSTLFAGNAVNPVIRGASLTSAQLNNAGTIDLTNGSGLPGNRLTVDGSYAGQNGTLKLTTQLNAGGALGNQLTDRLLIGGSASGTTTVDVNHTALSNGALTDLNHNSIIESTEGISLVQVAGTSDASAFSLRNGYVNAGPWRYSLYAFAPGRSDSSQREVSGDGNTFWDYRLANAFLCDGSPCPPPPTDPLEEVTPPAETRPMVVPQVPSYVSAPSGLAIYSYQVLDNLHRRLGEVRQTSDRGPGYEGEFFIRYISGDYRQKTDLSFREFGFDYDLNMDAVQFGMNLLNIENEHSTLRGGIAYTRGSSRIKPRAADGDSNTAFDVDSLSLFATWQDIKGWYVDAVLSGDRARGHTDTDTVDNMANLRGNLWTASIEAGYPWQFANGVTLEPQVQITRQQVQLDDTVDDDGNRVNFDSFGQNIVRVGARLTRTWKHDRGGATTPYARLNYIRGSSNNPKVTISDTHSAISQTFEGAAFGKTMEAGLGLTSQLTNDISLYGEATYQKELNDNGLRGWGSNVGLRWNF
ncbi:autotransporter outer membrane beta-barrel domain-containing protein [Pseudomonas chlororaphis]|uniref:Outer membrane autotransporter barrel domain protein n=1 Tax=Pseudomonas chlororaphis O6 TaxID=1037915 RepID=A0AB33X006_9PSED|nr:autotransporter outer membrane beta-barrel domain-containing protein [Pseudomonas chlororaphis]EIM18796.1 outer membrane autotransporter barrel domain protein [Pseudomonas chlororaphis O6]